MDLVHEAAEETGIYLKKVDKKQDRQAAFNHRHVLTDSLVNESDMALVLHVVVCLVGGGRGGLQQQSELPFILVPFPLCAAVSAGQGLHAACAGPCCPASHCLS